MSIAPLAGSGIRQLFCGAGGGISRYFATFDGTDDFVQLPTMVATGDFELNISFYRNAPAPSTLRALVGIDDTSISMFAILQLTSGRILTQIPAQGGMQFLSISYGTIVLNGLNKVSLTRVGDLITFTLNGVSTTRTRNDWDDIYINTIGEWGGLLAFDGILADVEFKSGFTTTGGSNPSYLINEGNSDIATDGTGQGLNGTYENFETDFSDRVLYTINQDGNWEDAGGNIIEVLP